ncbi:MAG: hypothetical protein ACR2KW_06115 [Rubrobacter sp.]
MTPSRIRRARLGFMKLTIGKRSAVRLVELPEVLPPARSLMLAA